MGVEIWLLDSTFVAFDEHRTNQFEVDVVRRQRSAWDILILLLLGRARVVLTWGTAFHVGGCQMMFLVVGIRGTWFVATAWTGVVLKCVRLKITGARKWPLKPTGRNLTGGAETTSTQLARTKSTTVVHLRRFT